jgi:hypothetical protein
MFRYVFNLPARHGVATLEHYTRDCCSRASVTTMLLGRCEKRSSSKKNDSHAGCEPMIDFGGLRNPYVDPLWRDTCPMLRAAIVRSFGVVLLGTSLALAQDPPPLEGPSSDPSPPKASSSTSAPTPRTTATNTVSPATAPSQARPMLVIPGVTAPTPRGGVAPGANAAQPSQSSALAMPSAGATSGSAAVRSTMGSPFRPDAAAETERKPEASGLSPIPLTLEPLDDDGSVNQKKPAPRSPRTNAPAQQRPARARESASVPVETRPAQQRIPGFLGRLLGQPPVRPDREASSRRDAAAQAKSKASSGTNPDAVLKRRIEQQIRATLGDKVQDVEVRVSGRNVLIAARPTRFWQKRGVYRSLESLPALAGFRARIDLDN